MPMLMVKPISDALQSGTRLVDATEAAGVPILVGHHRRHSPLIQRAREIVQSLSAEHCAVAAEDPLTLQMRHFCSLIGGEAQPLLDGREVLRTLEATLAMKLAADTGEVVRLGT